MKIKMEEVPNDQNPYANTPKYKIPSAERKRRELWLYMAVSIIAIELLIFGAALLFAFIKGTTKSPNADQLLFPWLSWAAAAIIVPSIMLLAVHMAVGLFRPSDKEQEKEWEKELPEKLQKAYRILTRTPAIILFGGILVLGALLLTLDGAIQVLLGLFANFKPFLPHILIGLALLLALLGLAIIWSNYKTRKLYAELEYRTAVLEKTGLIITNKHQLIIDPAGERLLTLESNQLTKALPQGRKINAETEIIEAEIIEAEREEIKSDEEKDESANNK